MKINFHLCFTVALAMVCAVPAQAAGDDVLAQAKKCTQYFAQYEREYAIPKHLLMGVAVTESGRWNKEEKMLLPWPWTVQSQGKGYYFDTMHDAITKVRQLQSKGITNIDVGCMQINLRHHPDAFASLTQALNPAYNVRYGASYLRKMYDLEASWSQAIASYHSQTSSLGQKYYARVKENWRGFLASADRKAFEPSPYVINVAEANTLPRASRLPSESSISIRNSNDGSIKRSNKQFVRAAPAQKMPSMKVIQVSAASRPRYEPTVMVYSSPGKSSPALQNAVEVKVTRGTSTTEETATASLQPKRISTREGGPHFIFD